jgi:hypothetical protein
MWGNIIDPGRSQMTIWRMRIACWITKATNINAEYVIRIAFPPQKWLRQRASMLRYTYIARLVFLYKYSGLNRETSLHIKGKKAILK